jgi:hypothetical protein
VYRAVIAFAELAMRSLLATWANSLIRTFLGDVHYDLYIGLLFGGIFTSDDDGVATVSAGIGFYLNNMSGVGIKL